MAKQRHRQLARAEFQVSMLLFLARNDLKEDTCHQYSKNKHRFKNKENHFTMTAKKALMGAKSVMKRCFSDKLLELWLDNWLRYILGFDFSLAENTMNIKEFDWNNQVKCSFMSNEVLEMLIWEETERELTLGGAGASGPAWTTSRM